MRVALVSSAYAPAVGGVERVVQRLATYLQEAGDTVEVWTIHHPSALAREENFEGVLVRRLPCPLPAADFRRLLSFPKDATLALREWQRAEAAFRPDVLNVHCFSAQGIYATLLSMRRHIPLVVTLHGETVTDDHNIYQRSITLRAGLRLALQHAATVVAPSRFVLADARRFGLSEDGSTVIPNGVDVRDEALREPVDLPDGRYIVAFGRQVRNKGFDLLIEAFSELAARFPSTRLVLGGDGPENASLSRMGAELGVGDRVHLTSWLRPAQVHWLLDQATLVVVPSRIESFGMAVFEALHAGRPVIATTRGGVGEFIEDGRHALLVDPTDVAALTTAMHRLLEDPRLAQRLASAGQQHAAGLTWPSIARRYQGIYREVA